MKSLDERQADRKRRAQENSVAPTGSRDDLQAQAEARVAAQDKEAGVASAPLASKTAKAAGKTTNKKTTGAKPGTPPADETPEQKAAREAANPFTKKD